MQPSSNSVSSISDEAKRTLINQRLERIYDRYVSGAGYTPCSSAIFRLCATDPKPGRLGKNDLEPRILVGATAAYIQGKKWKVMIAFDYTTLAPMYRMEGPVNTHTRTWDISDEDARLVGRIVGEEPDLVRAKQADDSHMRAWPYLRKIEGITYKKSEQTKRSGPKGDLRERQPVSSNSKPTFGDTAAIAAGRSRTRRK